MERSESYTRSVSTRAGYEPVKIALPPKAKGAPPQASVKALKRMVRNDGPLTITLISRGGAEWWFEVKARGAIWRVPYITSVGDLVVDILEGQRQSRS